MFTKERPLRVGTDCSGIEAPIVALEQLRIPFFHEFSSEIDKHCIATIRANFSPRIIFGDMTQRRLKDVPDIDLYVCGFPCQPFSTAGKREGVRDPRGTIFWECLRVIRAKRPMVFILENVRGLLSIDGGETFRTIIAELEKIKGYNVGWKILNTADYGIPQSRKRVFIVGIHKKKEKKEFKWPEPIPCRPLSEFVDWEDTTAYPPPPHILRSGMLDRIPRDAIFINMGFPKHNHTQAHILCPCLTTSKCTMYCLPTQRYMNHKEFLMLQGFSPSFVFHSCKNQIFKQIGNSMSVNVIYSILKETIKCMT
jgi:DNA (cytosine-5)-methyltransferase 1